MEWGQTDTCTDRNTHTSITLLGLALVPGRVKNYEETEDIPGEIVREAPDIPGEIVREAPDIPGEIVREHLLRVPLEALD